MEKVGLVMGLRFK